MLFIVLFCSANGLLQFLSGKRFKGICLRLFSVKQYTGLSVA